MESITSIGELLIAGDVETYHGKKKSNIWMEIFRFEDVSFHYPDSLKPIIRSFSLEVKAGEKQLLLLGHLVLENLHSLTY